MFWLIFFGSYLVMAIIMGAVFTAGCIEDNHNDPKNTKPDYLSEDQGFMCFFGAIFWPLTLPFVISSRIADALIKKPKPTQKCILCGTENPVESMHCHHCGNMMKGKV